MTGIGVDVADGVGAVPGEQAGVRGDEGGDIGATVIEGERRRAGAPNLFGLRLPGFPEHVVVFQRAKPTEVSAPGAVSDCAPSGSLYFLISAFPFSAFPARSGGIPRPASNHWILYLLSMLFHPIPASMPFSATF